MALIDVKCAAGHVHEVVRAVADWPATPPCPTCAQPTEQIHLPKAVQWRADPVIVFRGPDGQYRFPGDANGLQAATYRKQGFEQIELRGAAEVRRFESHMNKREFRRAARKAEFQQQAREFREGITRSELRARMQSMSAAGRAIARAAMQRNDNKPREYAKDAGFHSEVYSFDRSNRDESRDSQGRRRRD
jgi:hypothetical protein